MDDLDDILKGNDEPQVEAPATPEQPQAEASAAESPPEPEAKAEDRPRGPDGKFISKGENEVDAPPASVDSPSTIPESALIGERRRRQEAEQEREQLRQQLATFQTQQAPQFQQPAAPQVAPDMFEDPEGYTRYITAHAAEAARSEAYQTFQYQRIESSAVQFAPTVPDYAEKVQVFQQMAQTNPALMQELYRAPNPAEYAYNTAKIQLEISQYGGIEGMIGARIEAALKAKAPEPVAAQPIPGTLATAQSARGSLAATEPPSLEDLLRS